REAIAALALPGVEVAVERVARSGIAAAKFHVRCPDQGPPAHDHVHRAWAEIRDLLAGSRLAAPVKERALAVFARLAEAEGRVHGVPADAVEFHEVGALDAIVDVVGAALGFVHLGVEAVYAGPLPMGQGRLRSAHGPLPVPAPAVVLPVAGRPVRPDDGAAGVGTRPAAGARDAFLVPVVMKKSRPATMLRVLAAPADRDRLAGIVFAETSTIGLRYTTWGRLVLPREERTVETPYGTVRVKIARAPDGTVNVAPEFEDCRRLATERGVALKLVHQAAMAAALR